MPFCLAARTTPPLRWHISEIDSHVSNRRNRPSNDSNPFCMFCPTAMSHMIVRRDTGEGYQAFLENLAKASGIETPTREDLSKIDKKRPKKEE